MLDAAVDRRIEAFGRRGQFEPLKAGAEVPEERLELDTGEVGTHAEVGAGAECEMVVRLAVHPELERIYEHRPDLILLDVQMPALDGPAMVRRLDPLDRDGSPIPIVLMSGIDGLATIAERLGTSFFLRKPFGVDNLIHVVRAALEGHSASRP